MSNNTPFELKHVSIRLAEEASFLSNERITSPQDAVRIIGNEISKFDREVMCVLNLTTAGQPINFSIVSMGAIDQTLASPREMFKASILSNAAQVIMLHNHPSGDVTPSKNDVMVTNRMIELFDKIGIQLSDHIIVGANEDGKYYSFLNENMFYHTEQKWSADLSDVHFNVAENTQYKAYDMTPNKALKDFVPNFGTKEDNNAPSSERYVFTTHKGQKVELDEADMHRVHQHYIEQMTANYLRENHPAWTEEKVQTIAVEVRRQMLKNDFSEEEAIEEVLSEFESMHYVELASKQVPDADGFMTDYTMYRDSFTGEYIFILGDKEAYTPLNSEADWMCDEECIALEWFGSYKGFEKGYDEVAELTVENGNFISQKEETIMEKSEFSIWIGNVAKYTEGNLDGQWVDLPKSGEELQEIINSISNNGQDEVMIFDFDIKERLAYLRDDISEYSSIADLNTLAQLLSLQEDHPAAELCISHAGNMTIAEICNVLMQEDELPYMRYEFEGSDNPEVMRNMSDETKLGYTLLERDVSLKALLENRELGSSTLIHYINVEDIGRDMVMSGYAEVGEFGWYDTQAMQPELELYTLDDVKEHIQEIQLKEQKHQQRILDERVINKNGPKL